MSCRDDEDIFTGNENTDGPVLRLSTGSSFTRDDGDGVEVDNYAEGEEMINRVDLFFFESKESTDAPFYVYEITGLGKQTTADLRVKMPYSLSDKFTEDKKPYVYALVNLPETNSVEVNSKKIDSKTATLKNLKEVWVETKDFIGAGAPQDFVMSGETEIEIVGSERDLNVSGTILLQRLASKVRLFSGIEPVIYIDKDGKTILPKEGETPEEWKNRAERDAFEVWESEPVNKSNQTSNVRLYFYNAAVNGRMDAFIGIDEVNNKETRYESIDRSNEKKDAVRIVKTGENLYDYNDGTDDSFREKYPYTHASAYYSYPNIWNSNNLEETHRTYVILSLPWRLTGGQKYDDMGEIFDVFYYQIPVNAIEVKDEEGNVKIPKDCLDPNRYYRMKIHIGMLGSRDLGTPLEIEASYEVLDWVVAPVDVNIKDRRYLVVNQKEWVMNNTSQISIPFSSSHEVEIVDCYVTYFRYNDVWGKDVDTQNAQDSSQEHNSTEFSDWLTEAEKENIKETEGEISLEGISWGNTGQTHKQLLYYKKEYFYDKIYDEEFHKSDDQKDHGNGYKYYIGHEHPKTFQKDLVKRPEGLQDDGWDLYEKKYQMKSVYTCEIEKSSNTINFNHPLVWWKEAYSNGKFYYVPETKNGKLRDEFSRCEISIIIRHKDKQNDPLWHETIHITQYPGMYIEVSHEYGRPNKNGILGNEYILINGNPTDKNTGPADNGYDTNTEWFEVTNCVTYFGLINNNPNMYVIHTTQLSEDNDVDYIIGDPRSLYYNNQLCNGNPDDISGLKHTTNVKNSDNDRWYYLSRATLLPLYQNMARGKRLEDDSSNELLKYYYPTDENDAEGSKEKFIAPSFRIASSLGKVSLSYSWASGGAGYLTRSSRKEARMRCATYQEAGRPAGRWRVPTRAEIEYLVNLSVDKKIPHLFGLQNSNTQSYYWCSTGVVGVNAVSGTINFLEPTQNLRINENPAVRCIYDEWYWNQIDKELGYELSPVEKDFIWGDVPKDNTQVKP